MAKRSKSPVSAAGSEHPVFEFLKFIESQSGLSVERLLDRILLKSRMMSTAEAGTIFLIRTVRRRRWLEPVSIQNDVLRIRRTDFRIPVGGETIAGYVAGTGKTIMIDDVYAIAPDSPFHFNPANEHKRYKTGSMFCFPLKNYRDQIVGVVQLINARRPGVDLPVPFAPEINQLVMAISQTIGHCVERTQMMSQIKLKNQELRVKNRHMAEQQEKIIVLQAETEKAFQVSISLLSRAAEIHDEETGNHIFRVNEYSYQFARLLGMSEAWCEQIRYSAQLHDVGKMSVDSAVLKKAGRLTDQEKQEMDRHTIYGHRILSGTPRLEMAARVALNHHEKWDGSGYPGGKKGEDIPLEARIVQLADIYDALRSERPYKSSFSHEEALRILSEGDDRINPKGHFDPNLLAVFRKNHLRFARVWKKMQD